MVERVFVDPDTGEPFLRDDEELPPFDLRGTGNVQETALRNRRRQTSVVGQGLRSGVTGLEAGLEGVAAIAAGLASPVIGDEPALQLAERAGRTQQFAQDVGPEATFEDALRGEKVGEFVAGAVARQLPNFTATIGTALLTGPVGGTLARGSASAVTKAALTQQAKKVVAARAAERAGAAVAAGRRRAYTELQDRLVDPAGRLARVESAEARAALLKAERKRIENEAGQILSTLRKQELNAFAKGSQRVGGTAAALAGSGIAAGESSSFLLDPEAEGSVQARSVAALFGAAGEGLTEAIPAIGILKNLGLGRTGGRALSEALIQRAGGGQLARVAVGAGRQAVSEGAQEVAAEFIMNVAHRTINENIRLLDDEALITYLEAGTVGAIVGGGLGGATSVRLRNPGASVSGLLQRQSEREVAKKEQELEALPPEERAQRAQDFLTRAERLTTATIGRAVLKGTQAGQRLLQSGDEQTLAAVVTALRAFVDPDANVDDDAQLLSAIQQTFGDEAALAVEIARQQLLQVERTKLSNLQADPERYPDAAERIQALQRRIQEIEEVSSDAEVESETLVLDNERQDASPSDELDDKLETSEFSSIRDVPGQFNLLFNGEGPNAQRSELDVKTPLLGGLARPFTNTQTGETTTAARTALAKLRAKAEASIQRSMGLKGEPTPAQLEEIRQQAREQVQARVERAGDIAPRVIRRSMGLPDSPTANQNREAQRLVIHEAELANRRLPPNAPQKRLPANATYDQAIDFLNQFEVLVEERAPKQADAVDEQALTDADLEQRPSISPKNVIKREEARIARMIAQEGEDSPNVANAREKLNAFKNARKELDLAEKALKAAEQAFEEARSTLPGQRTFVPQSVNARLIAARERVKAARAAERAARLPLPEQKFLLEAIPKNKKLGDTQIEVVNPVTGRPAALNLQSLTQEFLGRDNVRGSETSQEALRRAGERAQQEGTSGGNVSLDDIARALFSGLAAFQDRAGKEGEIFNIPDDKIVFRNKETGRIVRYRDVKSRMPDKMRRALEQLQELEAADTTGGVRKARAELERAETVQVPSTSSVLGLSEKQQERVRALIRADARAGGTLRDRTAAITKRMIANIRAEESKGVSLKQARQKAQSANAQILRDEVAKARAANDGPMLEVLEQLRPKTVRKSQVKRADAAEKKTRATIKKLRARIAAFEEKTVLIGKVLNAPAYSKGGAAWAVRALQARIDRLTEGAAQQITAHSDQVSLEMLRELKTFFETLGDANPVRRITELRGKLEAELKQQEKYLEAVIVMRELFKQQRREQALSKTREQRQVELLREFAEDEFELARQFAGESEIDAFTELPRTFGELQKRIKQRMVPPWMRRNDGGVEQTVPNTRELRHESAILSELANKLDLNMSVRVVDWVEYMEISNTSEKEMAQNDGLIFMERDSDGRTTAVIWVNETLGAGTTERVGVLYHEFGHAVLVASSLRATDAEVAAIWKDYRKWVSAQKNRKVSGTVQSRRSLTNLLAYSRGDMRNVRNLSKAERKELLDFQEWFADQVARYMETSPRAQAAAEAKAATLKNLSLTKKFFTRLANAIRQIRSVLRNDGAPAESVRAFLDAAWGGGRKQPVRRFDMWKRLEVQGNRMADPNNEAAIDALIRQIAKTAPRELSASQKEALKDKRAQRRVIEAAHVGRFTPFNAEGFFAARDLIAFHLQPEEKRVLAQALNAPPVRKQVLEAINAMGRDAEQFTSDVYNYMAVAYQLWQAGELKLKPSASAWFTKIHKQAIHITGELTQFEQAEQILKALADNRIALRRPALQALAPAGSKAAQGAYFLGLSDIVRAYELRAALPDGVSAEAVLNVLKADERFRNMRTTHREALAEDLAAGVYTEALVNKLQEQGSAAVDPDEVFVLQRYVNGKQPTRNLAAAIVNVLKTLRLSGFGRLVLGEASQLRLTQNAAIIDILNQLMTDVASTGRAESMVNLKTRRRATFENQYFEITNELSPEQQIAVRDILTGRTKDGDAEVVAAVARIRALMSRMRQYALDAGLRMGRVENYWPWVFDPVKTDKAAAKLTKSWSAKKFRKDWERLARKHKLIGQNESLDDATLRRMIAARLDAIRSINNGLVDTTEDVIDLTAMAPAPRVAAMNERELGFLWDKGDENDRALISEVMSDDINGTMASYIAQLVKRAEYARAFGADGSKLERKIAQAKELGATDAEIQLVRNAVHSVMGTLGLEIASFWKATLAPINAALRTRPIMAKNGQPFTSEAAAQAKLAKMKTGGNIVRVEGEYVIERDLTQNPRRFRQLQSALVTYQNFRLLVFAALTNVADAAGIFVRTGDAQAAFEGYRAAVSEVWKAWNERKLTPAEKFRRRSEQRRLAEELGAIEASSIADQLGQFYGSVFMDGAVKKYNDAFFKWTGMEGLMRVMRQAAVVAARRSVTNHVLRAMDGQAESIDWLRQIDLEPRDVVMRADGELDLLTHDQINSMLDPLKISLPKALQLAMAPAEFEARRDSLTPEQLRKQEVFQRIAKDERVKRALFRLVDESVLRPSSTQRPTWMNDPNWQIFSHLKGFMFAYHERVLRRAYTKLAQGDYGPALYMMSYVPVMMAADLAREFVQYGFEGDDRKERWTIVDRALDGLHRSGVMGTFNVIPDMMKTASMQKNPLIELGGPTVSQINQWMNVVLGNYNPKLAAIRLLPAHQLLLAGGNAIERNSTAGRAARAEILSNFPLTNEILLGGISNG